MKNKKKLKLLRKIKKEIPIELSKEQIEENFKSKMVFPYGRNRLEKQGFKDEDILEIRQILVDEIKRQNDKENNN